jgi:hypothetical protein
LLCEGLAWLKKIDSAALGELYEERVFAAIYRQFLPYPLVKGA